MQKPLQIKNKKAKSENRDIIMKRLVLDEALRLLKYTGMKKLRYAPPIYSFLWKIGVLIPPPHFNTFSFNLIFNSAAFGVCIFIFSLFKYDNERLLTLILMSSFFGFIFGTLMAFSYKHDKSKFSIPSWSNFKNGAKNLE